MLRPIKNSLCGIEVYNDPLEAKVVVPADFIPSVQVVVKKQDSSFLFRTEKSLEIRKSAVVYKKTWFEGN